MTFIADQGAVELVASYEGYVDGVYADSRGLATGGYGHLLHMSAPTRGDHARYDHRGRAYWLSVLHADIERDAIAPMNRYLHRPLNVNQARAVISACINCGPGFIEGTVGRLINQGRMHDAANAFLLWDHPPELRPRRQQERALFLTPVHPATVRLPWLRADERRWCLELDRLAARHADIARRRVLRRVIHRRAVQIAFAAHHEGGWELAHRRQRYHSLTARLS